MTFTPRRIVLAAAVLLPWTAMWARPVHVPTATTSLVVDATEGQPLKFLYYGERLSDADVAALEASGTARHDAYPVYGMTSHRETAMSVTHPDGNMTLDMAVTGVSESDGAD
ncbi:MAG: alpha-galactosidase, partial [Muribaculaceae bacterium]|nr:alpha-galactosidase [Muribaculaceae bacterium]